MIPEKELIERLANLRDTSRSAILHITELSAGNKRLAEHMWEVEMRAHQWMQAHDKLQAGKPYDLPSPADLPEWKLRCGEARNALSRIWGVLMDAQQPRRSETERCVCINRALQIVDAVLNDRDSDGTPTGALCEDIAVPKDCQARAESIAQKTAPPNHPRST